MAAIGRVMAAEVTHHDYDKSMVRVQERGTSLSVKRVFDSTNLRFNSHQWAKEG